MRRNRLGLLLMTCAGSLLVSACASRIDPGPSIATVSRDRPDESKLAIRQSERVEANQELAIENYRKILELAPDGARRTEVMRRLADLQVQIGEVNPQYERQQELYGTEEPLDSINLYREILATNPDDPNNDRVLYQLARAYQNRGQEARAIEVLSRLTRDYPTSRYATDGKFREAELSFRLKRFREAEVAYREVVDYGPDGQFFEQAQYKLGWSIFKQSRYLDAADAFMPILERELAPGQAPIVRDQAVAGVREARRELVGDVLRVVGLSFAYSDGGATLKQFLSERGGTRYEELLFASLGELFLEQERYTDAAAAFKAYVDYEPFTLDAPTFQLKSIDALRVGGFQELAMGAKEDYVQIYDPEAEYWTQRGLAEAPFVVEALKENLNDVARYYHARAQRDGASPEARKINFDQAGRYYRRFIEIFPDDPASPEMHTLLADTLYDRGQYQLAAEEYTNAAYNYPPHPRAAAAGYGAVDSYHKWAEAQPPEQRRDATLLAVDAARRFADNFATHPQTARALTRAAEDLYDLDELEPAAEVAARVVTMEPRPDARLRRSSWQVLGLTRFDQQRFQDAEGAFKQVLQLTPPDDVERRQKTRTQIASAIYKQGEVAREQNRPDDAVGHFLRIGQEMPDSEIRATAQYDAAAVLIADEQWTRAIDVLLDFRKTFPSNELQRDVTKKLAAVYLSSDQPTRAAAEFSRMAGDQGENETTRREAAIRAAELYDENGALAAASRAYASYLAQFPVPFEEGIEIRQRLIEIHDELNQPSEVAYWRRQLINANAGAGAEQTDRSRYLAAKAALVMAETELARFEAVKLTLPLQASLTRKRAAMDQALEAYRSAAQSGVAEIATEATYRVGSIYLTLSRDLMASQRPAGLSALELEQYELLLEEQAFPIEEQAIDVFESNVERMDQGVYDQWVQRSIEALAEIVPARYAKQENYELPINTIR